ncbi:hypothetical protein IMX26_16675 [Clostridium sp. 'deep sea']|uniref:hypothetical protein n=1 Tax=Clostridium sp. 'deep sea' TaxID=2779445 RepID=UPI001896627F|nr:hypothetical protein [Clostridium sp. 'deep sea']QOR35071.1 hypothetical protein IMX26_16675 [Clostridium sp. 'deep sea']
MKYLDPKIMCIDIEDDVIDKLIQEGFNVDRGSFGYKYLVNPDSECKLNYKLEYLSEKEVVIINLKDDKVHNKNEDDYDGLYSGYDTKLYSLKGSNYLNPRNLTYLNFQEDIRKLLYNGNVVIVLADAYVEENYNIVEYKDGYGRGKIIKLDNYSWLNIGSVTSMTGRDICISNEGGYFRDIFKGCKEDEVTYLAIFEEDRNSLVLAKNRYEDTIAFVKLFENDGNDGLLIVLPQFQNQYIVINNLLKEVLPQIKPHIFPDFVKNIWLELDDYILPKVQRLEIEKKKIERELSFKINDVNKKIQDEKDKLSFLTNILTSNGFGELLVKNIQKTLLEIGYSNVVNVDDTIEGNKQEDLNIYNDYGLTVIEIKGHNGNPTEDDCQALLKYMNRNMKKHKRSDIHGILIVNHQKMLPPLERSNPAFTKEQIADAVRDEYTLVSTWELYKSVRLLQENLINFNDIDISLHTKGLFTAIPKTWLFLGIIKKLFQENTIACFYLEIDQLNVGDELIVQDKNNYFLFKIEEMMIENKSVNQAKKQDKLSIKISKSISKNAKIYKKITR